ncbi:hypothetical protein ACIPY6_07975 [Streptomyces sp. NPDC090054]|uniref:hypothetical protein n=1 Tax=Streptomyces sp. NPDC090054 TaxID=3365933 RepID=UPI00380E74EB
MSASLITAVELSVKPDQVDAAVTAWKAHHAASGFEGRALFRNLEGAGLLELAPVTGWEQFADLRSDWAQLWDTLAPVAEGDFRRQVLGFVDAPKPADTPLPQTPYIQMRHIEVPPRVHPAYRAWREETIYDVVRTADEVEVFEAYHSVLSTEPGVMFVSGFSCDPAEYTAVFTSPRYQEIVRQAGDRFIAGGERGLYTTIYARVS